MSLIYNLSIGWAAVAHVRRTGVRASNTGDMANPSLTTESQWLEHTRCIGPYPANAPAPPDSVRGQFTAFCKGLDATACLQQRGNAIVRLAELAGHKRCGNCAEQDAVALAFLMERLVAPLDLMNLMPHSGIDHTFVVIGRLMVPKGGPDCLASARLSAIPPAQCWGGSTDKDPSTWGPEAVVCDPWHDGGKVYPAAEMQTKMFRGYHGLTGPLQPASIWRYV